MNDSKDHKAASEPPLDCRVGRCDPHCDYENAKLVSRAKWCCPNCGRDFSLEYLFWAKVAHPEWFDEVPNAIELTGSPLAASPATGRSDVE